MALRSSEDIFFVPAHIWTPWFSALGDKSGFDKIEECYEDLSDHIFAVETGLSSDPPMNWICSFLDKYRLISNSDAHSPEKLGREANLFDTELSYDAIINALKTGSNEHFLGTVEFFPQEGKYHYDGHRKCGIVWDPVETLKNRGICPVCGKKITVGVMNRIMQLSDRTNLESLEKISPFYSLIPLKEILSEIMDAGPNSKKVSKSYFSVVQKGVPELDLLLEMPVEDIKTLGIEELPEAVKRMRDRMVYIKEGFDGEYGQIKVFQEDELKSSASQGYLFKEMSGVKRLAAEKRKILNFDLSEYRRLQKNMEPSVDITDKKILKGLNPEQQRAVTHFEGPALIIAGPGTGKTLVLTYRIASLIQNKKILPENILAVTFTNKASNEMKERLETLLGDDVIISKLTVSTFHALGFSILKKYHDKFGRTQKFSIIDENDKSSLLYKNKLCEKGNIKDVSGRVTDIKQRLKKMEDLEDSNIADLFKKYEDILKEINSFDLDDLISLPVRLFAMYPEICSEYRNKFQWILVDEYQDINFSQYSLIRSLLGEKGKNLCVIGDPDQAIYGFRGADITFIKDFLNDYPEASIYRLKKSYRCTDYILEASNEIIKSEDQKKQSLKGINKGVKIKISKNISDRSEAEFVARTIEDMIGGLGFFSIDSQITGGDKNKEIESLSDFAVLCRLTSQMAVVEEAFKNHSIPYQTVGETPFFKTEPVRSAIDLLELCINPENSIIKDRLFDKKIIDHKKLQGLNDLNCKKHSVKELISKIIDEFFFERKSENEELFNKLLGIAENFSNDLEKLLQFVSLGKGVDTFKPDLENVTIMTIHSAKGLEFKCVFITGCEQGLLPYSLFRDQTSDVEEEKRLLYVGMTRAKKFLYLCHAEKRHLFGNEYRLRRSPFLETIEKDLVEISRAEHKKKEKKEEIQLKLFDI